MNKRIVVALTAAIALGTAAAVLWPHEPSPASQPEADTIVPAKPTLAPSEVQTSDLPKLTVLAPSASPTVRTRSTHASHRTPPSSSPQPRGPVVDPR